MGGKVLLAVALLLAPPARGGDAGAQLAYATRAKRSLRGTRGERRDQARTMVVEAYRAVRVYFPEARSTGAMAAFRAAELLRSGRLLRASRAEFEQAWLLGRGVRIGARAGLELGHLERRRRRLNDALAWYEDVESLGPDFAEERDLAAYWTGRVHGRMGRVDDQLRLRGSDLRHGSRHPVAARWVGHHRRRRRDRPAGRIGRRHRRGGVRAGDGRPGFAVLEPPSARNDRRHHPGYRTRRTGASHGRVDGLPDP